MLAYKRMGHSPTVLESPSCVLFEFNEATTIFLRDVILFIKAEPVTLYVRFSVVVDLMLYNAILGWA